MAGRILCSQRDARVANFNFVIPITSARRWGSHLQRAFFRVISDHGWSLLVIIVIPTALNDCVRSVFGGSRVVEALLIRLPRRLLQGTARKRAQATTRQRIVRGSSLLSIRYRSVRGDEVYAIRQPTCKASAPIRLCFLRVTKDAWEVTPTFSPIRANKRLRKVSIVRRSEDLLTNVGREDMFVLSPRLGVHPTAEGGVVTKSTLFLPIRMCHVRCQVAKPATRYVPRHEAMATYRKDGYGRACPTTSRAFLRRFAWIDYRGVHFCGEVARCDSASGFVVHVEVEEEEKE